MRYCKWCGLGFECIRTTKVFCSVKCICAEYYEENKEKIAENKKNIKKKIQRKLRNKKKNIIKQMQKKLQETSGYETRG